MAVFKAVSVLFLFGFSLMAIGGWYMLIDQGIVQEVITDYWLTDEYLDVMRIEWHSLPIILFIVGAVCAIASVATAKRVVYT